MSHTMTKRNSNMTAAPFGGLVDQFFHDNLTRLFDDSFWGFNGLGQRNVAVNLKETDTGYEMELVAPGLKKEQFKINLEGDLLTVSFDQQEENTKDDNNYRWLKREYRREAFARSFTLDDSLDANKITAEYRDGILYVTLPKKENAQRVTRQIEIK